MHTCAPHESALTSGSRTVTHKVHSRKGHESINTTQVYLHADLTTKENALDRTVPTGATPGRYHPEDDTLLTFLQNL